MKIEIFLELYSKTIYPGSAPIKLTQRHYTFRQNTITNYMITINYNLNCLSYRKSGSYKFISIPSWKELRRIREFV